MNPAVGIALIVGALSGLMLGVRAMQRAGAVDAELARKLVHMGMGTVCLSLPWLFGTDVRPVWALAVAAVAGLTAVRFVPALRNQLGRVLGGVERASWGEVYFPAGVALVFALARGRPEFFCVPVAILTYADAAGALVGRRFGRTRYEAVESTKSVEGSAAVLLVTWACVTGGLLVLADFTALQCWLMGLGLGLFAMLVEAVSWRGLDNLLLPLAALAQLEVTAELDPVQLIARVFVLTAMTVFMLVWRRGTLMNQCASLGAALSVYLFWSVGGWRWLIAPVVLMVSYVRLMPTIPHGPARHNLAAVICIASAGLPWMVTQAVMPGDEWLWLFTVGLATQQAIIAAVRFSQGRTEWRPWQWWLIAVVQAVLTQGLGFIVAHGLAEVDLGIMATGAGALAAALALFMIVEPRLSLPRDLNLRWWWQGMTAVLASLGAYAAMTA